MQKIGYAKAKTILLHNFWPIVSLLIPQDHVLWRVVYYRGERSSFGISSKPLPR